MSYEFKPGKYKTRDGHDAVVCGIVPEPTEVTYRLLGYTIDIDGYYRAATWTADGKYTIYKYNSDYDLLPLAEHRYLNIYNGIGSLACWRESIEKCEQLVKDCSTHLGYLHETRRGNEVEYEFIPKEQENE